MGTTKKILIPSDYVHLHNHSHYSLLDGLSKVPAMLDYAKELGMKAMALTDHGTMSGLIEFYKEARARGIKPILGMEAYVATRQHTDREPSKDKNNYHVIILAMNNVGYQNLMKLSTIANLEGLYYKPRLDHELLHKYNEGLIILSGCIGGEVGDALRQDQYAKAKQTAEWYKSIFGDRYYLEVQDHGHKAHPAAWEDQVKITKDTLRLAKELKIEAVVTCDAHYLKHEDQEAHEVLLCVQTGSYLADENRMSLRNLELHVTDPKEIVGRWGEQHPELIVGTKAIADRCDVTLPLGKILLPKFPMPKEESEKSYLEQLVYKGLYQRYVKAKRGKTVGLSIAEIKKTLPKEVLDRAEFELNVIANMNFSGYFLIIWDFINWGKNQGIVFGPGRGSAAGSIVSYALRITELDPLRYDLLFERFLNPDRISMPDIDIDIQDSRRDEVIRYCIDKYGEDRVANIVTFGKMAARNAVRDVARVLQVPYAEADRLAKMIPPPVQGRHIPLATSLNETPELIAENSNEQSARVFELAIKLEGTIRSHGVHAAGVVIAPDKIVEFVPLEMAQKGVVATQYSMGPIEDLGLLKIDFLGLSNLTIIKNALRIIKKVYSQDVDISLVSLDDKETFSLLARGDTTGVFQFESSGMKRYLKDLKPTAFDDIIAMGALYRPGPMQWIEDFIARKHGKKAIEYLHPAMEPALKSTYGIIVYQEQVMQISKELAGFSGGQADTLRKGIGKKIPQVLAKLKNEFIDGAIKTSGVDRQQMEKFWKQLEAFAAYAFPKAHAACYAMTSYQTAYLKANYPAAFMAALMTSDYDDTDRLSIEITECKHMGIEVLPPDINESFVEFAVVPTGDPKHDPIRFGMSAIKNVGTAAVEEILRAREGGIFEDLEDFFSKVNVRIVNRKTLESLIKAGAFDRYSERSRLLSNLDSCLSFATRMQKDAISGQVDIFGGAVKINDDIKPRIKLEETTLKFSAPEQLKWERELLGIYLSQHPLKSFETYLAELTMSLSELKPDMDNKTVIVGGAIVDHREIMTKNGQKMAFIKIADLSGEVELVLFPSVYQQTAGIWERDKVVLIRGKVNSRDRRSGEELNEVKIIADEAREITLEQAEGYQPTGKRQKIPLTKTLTKTKKVSTGGDKEKRIYLRLINTKDERILGEIKQTVDDFKGSTEVVLVLGEDDRKQIIKLPGGMQASELALERLRATVGAKQVVVS